MNRIEASLISILAVLLLMAAISGCLKDESITAQRVGSDFADSANARSSGLTSYRAEQTTRREQTGLEAVSGVGLLMLRIFLYRPKRKTAFTRLSKDEAQRQVVRPAERKYPDEAIPRRRPKAQV